MAIPKTLIIGLGGLGSDIVVDVYKKFNSHSAHKVDREKVKFLALDTDSNQITARREIMKPEDVIQTSSETNIIAGRFIDDIKFDSTVEKWFPVETKELTQMTMNDGAGQIRTVSRLAFSHAIYSGKLDRLGKVISELLALNTGEGNNIQVHIVSSLAGGTGAGSFLQATYYVREILTRSGIEDPTILGYFLLGDVFLRDPSINMSDSTKTTSILANTYACIKELNGIFGIDSQMKIEFEYGYPKKSPELISKDNSKPFSQCFLYDYENKDGNNILNVENYKAQIIEFLYLNAFSPTGPETRSQAINNIFRATQEGAASKYGSTGISKIVYPIENLLKYFAVRRLSDNLRTTWLKIDNDFNALHKEWTKDTSKGIIRPEPILSEFFIRNVDTIATNGSGVEQAVFKNIWMSTKVIDEESQSVVGDKTEYLLYEIVNYLTSLRDSDIDITELSEIHHNESFTTKEHDEANDRENITRVENQLEALKREVFSFINDNKRIALEEVFVKDSESPGYVNEEVKHRINKYILQKDKAMHPLAQRYFYYDLLHKLEDNLISLRSRNSDKLVSISAYKEIYDIKDEDGKEDTYIETALDAYNIYREDSTLAKKLFSKVMGKSSQLEDFKSEYVSKSKRQAKELNEYALEKLEEVVFEGLVVQVKKMIENLEKLFKAIPDVLVEFENTQKSLVSITENGNPSINYILSDKEHRDFIYNETIAQNDTIFFPEDMSRNIYQEIFHQLYLQVNNPISYANDDTNKKIKNIFSERVVKKQIEQLEERFNDDFAGYNIIQAMGKHAEIEGINKIDFMSAQCREAERKATPFGAKYDNDSPKINAWALHPECVENQYLNPKEADVLFNNPGVNQANAERVISDYFDRTEILREDSVMILSVPKHFPKFAGFNPDQEYSKSQEGIYYTYYKKRMKEIRDRTDLPSPHLDKRWDNPRFFRDLGVDINIYEKNIIRAFVFGLVNQNLKIQDNLGALTWGYTHPYTGIEFLKDNSGKIIKSDIRKLLTDSLWNNEKMVDEINAKFDKEIENAKNIWSQLRMQGRSMINIPLLENIRSFKFVDLEAFKDKNLLTFFNGYVFDIQKDGKIIIDIIDLLLDTIIEIVGNNGENTKNESITIIESMIKNAPTSGVPISKNNLETFLENCISKKF